VRIEPIDPADPRVQALLTASDEYHQALYPAESNHLEGVAALRLPNVYFVAALDGDAVVACGAVRIMDDDGAYGEIKRVFVLPAARGRGLSRRIMDVLEQHLAARGVRIARLETGPLQPEALGLYRRLGYVTRTPFGSYAADPLSVFMEKRL
jgi:putative acetyltransferase